MMRTAGEVTYADAHKEHPNEGLAFCSYFKICSLASFWGCKLLSKCTFGNCFLFKACTISALFVLQVEKI